MKLQKIRYYLSSGFTLFKNLTNLQSLINLLIYKKAIITTRNGFSFEILTLLDLLIIKETIFDDCYQLIRRFAHRKLKIIVDIGAGFGDFSIMAAKIHKEAIVYAFEPNPKLYKLLINNIKRSGLLNIKTYPYAVGRDKELFLNTGTEYTQSSMYNSDSTKKIRVKSVTFDSISPGNSIDFLKMDCEGGEYEIIKSLSLYQIQRIKYLSMEYHNLYIPRVDEFVINRLRSHFKIKKLKDPYDKGYGLLFAQNIKYSSA